MKIKNFRIIFLAFLIINTGLLVSHAEQVVFEKENFGIDLPSGWKRVDAPAPIVVLAAENSDRKKSVLVTSMQFPANEKASSSRDTIEGIKSGISHSGWEIMKEGSITIGGLPFYFLAARGAENRTAIAYSTSVGDRIYVMQIYSISSVAADDLEIESLANSFHLLSRAEANESAGYRIGFFLGRNLFPMLIMILVVAVGSGLLIYALLERKRNQRLPRRPRRKSRSDDYF